MTLIIFHQCSDGSLIIMDRKESNTTNVGQFTKKYFLAKNNEFLTALAGDSSRIDTIFTSLTMDSTITSDNVITKLDEIINKAPIFGGGLLESSGLLITKDKNHFVFHNVWFTNSQRSIVEENPPFKCYGEGAGLADYLIRKFTLTTLSWKKVYQFLISIMQEVSTSIDSVGSLEKFGFDVILLSNNGVFKTCTLNEWDGNNLKIDYDPKDDILPCIDEDVRSQKIPLHGSLKISKQGIIEKTEPIKELSVIDHEIPMSNSISVESEDGVYDVEYSIMGGKILSIKRDPEAFSLIIFISSETDGELKIKIPRKLLDAKLATKDEEFFVLADGGEHEFSESRDAHSRTLSMKFVKGMEELEIIGTDLLLSTDKSKYNYGDTMIISVTDFGESDEPILLTINDAKNNEIFNKTISLKIETETDSTHQEQIPIEGKIWLNPILSYTITAKSRFKTKQIHFSLNNLETRLILDKKVYSWTDKVNITIIAPELINDFSKVESIGNDQDHPITIATSKGTLSYYRLMETGKGTGIFNGSVTLTGFQEHQALRKDVDKSFRGLINGNGPFDGKIACSNSDGISVSLKTPGKIFTSSAIIRWNIGEIQWLNSSYPAIGKGEIRLVDPDVSLDPEKINTVEIKVWSDSDTVGIPLTLTETDKNTGIFKGIVYFTQDESNTPKLLVSEGDMITAEYMDKTLPEPYSTKDELAISATTMIGTLLPPLQKISVEHAEIIDVYGNHLAQIETGQTVLVRVFLKNNQTNPQSFACILQVEDDFSTQISLSSISGTLEPNQKLSPAISWTAPKPGDYMITIFIWKGLDEPTALSPPTTLNISAVGDEVKVPTPKDIVIKESNPIESKIVKTSETIKIPPGSSYPGCQDTHECYIPSNVKIRVNKTITWTNEDEDSHTVTSGTPDLGPDGVFDSGMILPEVSFAHTFKKKGKFHYFCMLHPWQTGIIEVE